MEGDEVKCIFGLAFDTHPLFFRYHEKNVGDIRIELFSPPLGDLPESVFKTIPLAVGAI